MKCLLILLPFIIFSQEENANFKYFSVGYTKQGTIWCSYRMTSEMVERDTVGKRIGFSRFNGISTKDYKNTGYDRGHLMPADALSFDEVGYNQTFSLANVVPMKPSLNRKVWKFLEEEEKEIATKHGCINVFISVEYGDKKIGKLHIPSVITKTINDCNREEIGVYRFEND